MKRIFALMLAVLTFLSLTACGKQETAPPMEMEPKVSQMKAICELAVMECYYHNVADFKEEDVEGVLWWKKDKHFWIEYSGIVKLGLDISQVNIQVAGDKVTIALPEAKVLGCKVDSASLTKESFIVDVDSAEITAEDEVAAFDAAQTKLEETARNDTALLTNAQQRAQALLEEYVSNIGVAVGKEYTIEWIYLDAEGEPLEGYIPVEAPEEAAEKADPPAEEG